MRRDKGHIPVRTCISCGKTVSKEALLRLTADDDGWVREDAHGRGRGAYVCSNKSCLGKAAETDRLRKAFRRQGLARLDPALVREDDSPAVQV